MSANKATLYDLPGRQTTPPTCWSPNVWKTRLVLNYKSIPYTTEWLTHAQIQDKLASTGLPPNQPTGKPGPQSSPYTLPSIRLADGKLAMDSALIAPLLEERYPSPSLHLENKLHEQAGALLGQVAFPLLGVLYPKIMRNVILPESVPVFRAKREKQFGCTVEEFEAAKGGETAWKGAEPGFAALTKFLKENKKDEGPFLMGSQVCYGDFILASMAEAAKRIEKEFYDRMMSNVDGMRELHEACGKWFEKDD